MHRNICFAIIAFTVFSCSHNKKMVKTEVQNSVSGLMDSIPSCLLTKIDSMKVEYPQGAPQSITRYQYKGKTVYYMVAPCCDKFNIVFDSACNVLGNPDGGFTGRGDGSLPDFKKEATNEKVVWKIGDEKNKRD